ncbi:MAG: nucleoside-diphosphate kinase [Candidatus Levybacteria bacterium]|nr:nucleoside-diphosphate kinase [Candidatus Levybacteria bacterium]
MERSVVLVKPDGVQRGLIGEIIHRFEQKGLKITACKMIGLTDEVLNQWYSHHADKPFFGSLKSYMKSSPVVAIVWEGKDAVATIRKMVGITLARQAEPGTIRGDLAMSQQYNLIHASESIEMAQKEQDLIFTKEEIFNWDKQDISNIYLKDELE